MLIVFVPNNLLYTTSYIIKFKKWYFEIYGRKGPLKSTHAKGNENLAKLLVKDTSDEEKEIGTPTPTADVSKP